MQIKASLLASAVLALGISFSGGAQAANLIVNGGFETGDFTGWTATEVSYPMYIVTSPVASGVYAAQIAGYAFGPDTLEQGVTDVAGQAYTLSFARWQDSGTPSGFAVSWNGVTIYSETDTGFLPFGTLSLNVIGTGADTLVFTAYNDPAFTYIDNVSLTAGGVPEPAIWALMIGGFGMAGAALRRRRMIVAA